VTSPTGSAPAAQWPCRGCGAQLEYAPGTLALTCPYCGTSQQLAVVDRTVEETPFEVWRQRRLAPLPTGVRVLECGTCRARTESDHVSTRCPFCGSPLVSDVAADASVAPEGVVPFVVAKRDADGSVRRWIRSRWFAPNALKKVSTTEAMEGTYLPFWTFDADTATDYTGQRGEYYYTTETYTEMVDGRPQTRTRTVRRIRWWPASGHVTRWFDDVVVPATTLVERRRLDRLEPYHAETAVAYQPEYLAGHQALRYDVDPDAGFADARQIMADVIEGDCRADIGGDEQRVHQMNTRYAAVTFKLLLIPLWIAAYAYGGRTYQVMVNAHTGEVVGERPWSAWKIALAVTAGVVAVAAVVLLWALYGR
jgi:Zn finger protein HypA/HybF involved in hydrogenase expression